MAVLTATGIRFATSNEINSRRWLFPTSTAWIFHQASAPTGWTKQTTHDNKALRVVSGSGGGSAGTNAFTTTMSSFSVAGNVTTSTATGGTALSTPQIPSHSHAGNSFNVGAVPAIFNPAGAQTGWNGGDVSRAGGWTRNSPGVGAQGAGDAHSHPVSASGPISVPVSIAVQYIDVLVCTFNG
jgi:hypothetical protein